METPVTAGDFPFQKRAIEEVARDALELLAHQATLGGTRPQQRLDAVAAREQFPDKIGTDET